MRSIPRASSNGHQPDGPASGKAGKLVEESWLRTAHWLGDNFEVLRLPASAFGV
jgi:hypothetical protein